MPRISNPAPSPAVISLYFFDKHLGNSQAGNRSSGSEPRSVQIYLDQGNDRKGCLNIELLPRVVGWSGFAHIPFNMYSEREENPSGRFMSAITQIPEKAPRNAALCGFTNIEIIQVDIAELPLPGTCADVDGSINLSPQKLCVLEEGFHVLEPGGRLYIADMVRDTSTEDSSCGCEQFRRLVGQLRRQNTRLGVLPANVGRSGLHRRGDGWNDRLSHVARNYRRSFSSTKADSAHAAVTSASHPH